MTQMAFIRFARMASIIAFLFLFVGEQGASGAVVCDDLFKRRVEVDQTAIVDPLMFRAAVRLAMREQYQSYEKWSDRAVIFGLKYSLRRKVEQACKGGDCSEEDVARIVQRTVIETFEKIDTTKANARRLRGYATLVGLSVGVAVANGMVKSNLPHSVQWVSEFVTIATSVSLYKLGAPFWDYLGGIFYRGAFRVRDGKSFFRDTRDAVTFGDHYKQLNEKMTPIEQQGATRIANLLGIAESSLSPTLESLQSQDPSKGGIERAAARIANFAIKTRKFFPDIAIDDHDLTRTIKLVFTDFIGSQQTRRRLYQMTIEQISQNDLAYNDKVTADVYRRALRGWIGVSEDDVESAPQ